LKIALTLPEQQQSKSIFNKANDLRAMPCVTSPVRPDPRRTAPNPGKTTLARRIPPMHRCRYRHQCRRDHFMFLTKS
jgi:hypothetical protein